MEVLSGPVLRFPQAVAREIAGEWWVDCAGPAEEVLPAGVQLDDDLESDQPCRLRTTVHEVYEHLRLTATAPSPAEAAAHLVEHVRRFSYPDMCRHQLPIWHGRRSGPSCRHGGVPDSQHLGVKVDAVRAMVTALDGMLDAVEHLESQRRPLKARVVDDVMAWPVLPEPYRSLAAAEVSRDRGALWTGRARQLVRIFLDESMRAAGVSLSTRWQPSRRPELALASNTTIGLYVVDLLAHIGLHDTDRSFLCSACGSPFTPGRPPRAGEGLFCRRPECQRRRASIKQAAFRARKGR